MKNQLTGVLCESLSITRADAWGIITPYFDAVAADSKQGISVSRMASLIVAQSQSETMWSETDIAWLAADTKPC